MDSLPPNLGIRRYIAHTGGTLDLRSLRGPRNASKRQDVMTGIMGRSVPKAKCGVNALREVLCAALFIDYDGMCLAQVESEIAGTIRAKVVLEQLTVAGAVARRQNQPEV